MIRIEGALDRVWRLLDRAVPLGDAGRRPSGLRVATLWLLGRSLALLVIPLFPGVASDVQYYRASLTGSEGVDPDLPEYPLPAAWLVTLPGLVARDDPVVFPVLFILLMLAVDAAFTAALHRRGERPPLVVWLAAGPVVGPVLWTRFDLVTGAGAAAALLVLARRPAASGLLIGTAAMLKLWPAVLLPLLAAPREGRRRVIVGGVSAVAALAFLVLLLEGPRRLVSPIAFQSERGMQIEALAALPLMAAWAVAHEPWDIFFSDYLTNEIDGPGAPALLALSGAATCAVLVLAAVFAARLWRRPPTADSPLVTWAVLAVSALLVLSNKVFSPQYLVWLVPVAAALVALDRTDDARRCAAALLVAGALGQLIYPVLYSWIWTPGPANLAGTALLAARLAPIAVAAWIAGRRTWTATQPPAAVAA